MEVFRRRKAPVRPRPPLRLLLSILFSLYTLLTPVPCRQVDTSRYSTDGHNRVTVTLSSVPQPSRVFTKVAISVCGAHKWRGSVSETYRYTPVCKGHCDTHRQSKPQICFDTSTRSVWNLLNLSDVCDLDFRIIKEPFDCNWSFRSVVTDKCNMDSCCLRQTEYKSQVGLPRHCVTTLR